MSKLSAILVLSILDSCAWYVTEEMKLAAADRDGDGHPSELVIGGDDCDDGDPQIHPKAVEVCGDGDDNDCDDAIDDYGVGNITWYQDADGDGFGDEAVVRLACPDALRGTDWSSVAGDCDDTRSRINPAAFDDDCDGVDDDCDGLVDNGTGVWFTDADGDGFGDPSAPAEPCDSMVRAVDNDGDCDDTADSVHPDALEICDGLDNDCVGGIDDMAAVTVAGQNFATVDGGLDVAQSLAGTTVISVCPGEFALSPRQITSGTSWVVAGSGRDLTTLRADDGETAFLVDEGGALEVRALTLTGSDQDHVLRAERSSVLTIEDARISGNKYSVYLRGIGSTGPTTRIERTEVIDNGVGGYSSGIYATGPGSLTCVDTLISGNHARGDGAGLNLRQSQQGGQTVLLQNVEVISNQSGTGDDGGGLFASGIVTLIIEDSTITNNAADSGGGMFLEVVDPGRVEIRDSDVMGNSADRGGGIFGSSGNVEVYGGSISNNVAVYNGGGMSWRTDFKAYINFYGVDMGVGLTDNEPDDVSTGAAGQSYIYGTLATFTCSYLTDACQ